MAVNVTTTQVFQCGTNAEYTQVLAKLQAWIALPAQQLGLANYTIQPLTLSSSQRRITLTIITNSISIN